MAGSVNKAIIMGRVGRDPEIRSMASGSRVANFTVATSETWRDKGSGERKERTEWHRITVWPENTVDVVDKYVRKGDLILIEGQIETRKWTDQGGQERYTTEVVVKAFNGSITLIGRTENNGGGGGRRDREPGDDDRAYDDPPPRRAAASDAAAPQRARRPNDDLDDEIPFVTSSLDAEPGIARKRAIV